MDEQACQFFGVGPVLPVHDIGTTVAYYRDQLGFNAEPLWGDPPTHGSVNRDRVGLQFTQAPNDFSSSDYPGYTYIFVTDVDQVAAEYRRNGISLAQEPTNHVHGMREFEIKDCNGYRLRFGQYLDQ